MTTAPASHWLQFRLWMLPLLSLLCGAAVWIYVDRVLVPHQVRYANVHGQPRGNLSDLYPRWIGARELLLHARDPYTAEVAREIQTGYYGRPLDWLVLTTQGIKLDSPIPFMSLFCLRLRFICLSPSCR